MASIKRVKFIEILDSQGYPALMASLLLNNGIHVSASVALMESLAEKRDVRSIRYQGKGLKQSIEEVEPIFQDLFQDHALSNVDQELIHLKQYGTNFVAALSIACLKAEAMLQNKSVYAYLSSLDTAIQMPKIMVSVLKEKTFEQNYMIVPLNDKSLSEHVRMVHDVIFILNDIMLEKGLSLKFLAYHEAIELILQAIDESGLCLGRDIGLAIDFASSYSFQNGRYFFDGSILDIPEYVDRLIEDLLTYPIVSLENPLAIEDKHGWKYFSTSLQEKIKRHVVIASHDLMPYANAIMINPGQRGTVMETLEALTTIKKTPVIFQSLHTTEDAFKADFAVGIQAPFVKFGHIKQGGQVAQYNRLLEIENEII